MAKESTLEKYKDHLWDDLDSLPETTESQRKQIMRFRFIVMSKLKVPSLTNTALVRALKGKFKIEDAQAYRSIRECEPFLANIANANREYLRYLVNETQKEAIKIARSKNDPDAMSRASAVIGRYNRLDQDLQDLPDFSHITPLVTTFVNDPGIMGVKVENPRAMVERVKKKHIITEDAEYIELKDE